MKVTSLLTLLLLIGCQTDKDGDGVDASVDCNDEDDKLTIAREEICNGIDDDCDGEIDNGVKTMYYRDKDGDGFGYDYSQDEGITADSEDIPRAECSPPEGFVEDNTDCNDDAIDSDADMIADGARVHPGATEVCDNIDNNCDGLVDDNDPAVDTSTQSTFYYDGDNDGYGDSSVAVQACARPQDHVVDNTDCDDVNYEVNPGASEVVGDVTNLDENCDDFIVCYYDGDNDGYGSSNKVWISKIEYPDVVCLAPEEQTEDSTNHFVQIDGDCDDGNSKAKPYAGTNEAGALAVACMLDADSDGYGDASPPNSNLITAGTDCDDSNALRSPGQTEVTADGVDQDCSQTDSCYADLDNDGYGSLVLVESNCLLADGCEAICNGQNESANTTDCDDADFWAHPDAAEYESDANNDGVDGDCTRDADEDGYADASAAGDVIPGSDCNDGDQLISPAAEELCEDNSIDENCDGLINDDSASNVTIFYLDNDNDSFGDPDNQVASCRQEVGYVLDNTDCDDTNEQTYPGAEELFADGVDQDCDSYEKCYTDADLDGYGDEVAYFTQDLSCLSGMAADNADDCDDQDITAHPGAAELDGDGTECMKDSDLDGYGDDNPSGAVLAGTDCNDVVGQGEGIRPDALEIPADGVDQDCNTIEECYLDADQDGYGSSDGTTIASVDTACDGEKESTNTLDCNDLNMMQNPDASEYCNDEDDNCDGSIDEGIPVDATIYYADADGDGYGSSLDADEDGVADYTFSRCADSGDVAPAGFVSNSLDCDDLDDAINPDALEVCDFVDNDCNGVKDSSTVCVNQAINTDFQITGPAAGSQAGQSIAVGDVNGDKVDDLVIAAPYEGNGAVYIIHGPVLSDIDLQEPTEYDAKISGITSDVHATEGGLGSQILVTDLDGDERDDLVISAPGADGLGVVYVVYAQPGEPFSSGDIVSNTPELHVSDAQITGRTVSVTNGGVTSNVKMRLGCTLAELGDINTDDAGDILIGTCYSDYSGVAGSALLLYGSDTGDALLSGSYTAEATGVNTTDVVSAMFDGVLAGDHFGEFVATAGDVDGDGSNDLLFGAPNTSALEQGTAYLLYGDPVEYTGQLQASTTMNAAVSGANEYEYLGMALGAAGDVNGDSYADFYISAPLANTERGYLALFAGQADALPNTLVPMATISGGTNNDTFGGSLVPVGDHPENHQFGDYDGDGYGDIMISAEKDGSSGAIYLFFGPLEGSIDLSIDGEASARFTGATMDNGLNTNFGHQLLRGDLNDDGDTDLVIASPLHDTVSQTQIGSVFIMTSLQFQ